MPGLHLPKYNDDAALEKPCPFRILPDVGGYAAVFMPGVSPTFIIKEATSLPQAVSVRGTGVKGLCSLNSRKCETGFAYIDPSGQLHEGQLPDGVRFGANGWAIRKLPHLLPDHEIRNVGYHTEHDVYIIVTRESVDFQAPEDDNRHPAADEGESDRFSSRMTPR